MVATLNTRQLNALEDLEAITNNNSLTRRHHEEWRSSAVSEEIIRLNVRTIYDGREVDKILNLNSKRRWKHSDALVPAWCVSGIDPLTDEPTLQGVQVKPDDAPINKDGKPLKYLGSKDFEAAPLFLNTGKEGFWKQIHDEILTPVFITEGAKKAGCLLSNNLASISIPGVSTCRKLGRLHQNLELFAKVGRKFYLCFDNDILHKEQVQKALIGLARELAANGSKVYVVQLPEGEAKGVDDYIATYGIEPFNVLVESAATFEEWLEEIKSQEAESEDIKPNSKLARYFRLIDKRWGEHLRYNTLKKEVELYGKELNEDEVRLIMALQFDIDISSADAQTIVRNLAKRDEYSPVVEYLDEVAAKHADIDTSLLDGLAKRYFGSDDPIHATYFKKFLVASVARARQPGCKVDSVLMLLSPEQGKYKSTFFSVLFGEDFFSDQLGADITSKDEKMKLSSYWGLEWAECDGVYKRKDVAAIKNFITNREDTFRAPYARKEMKHPRPCVFVGTSNEREILHDPTGDRRFWIIPVTIKKIPLEQVQQDKDKVWAAADALYKSGFQWWLTDEEELARAEHNKEFQSTSYWDEAIEHLWVELGKPNFLATEAIIKALGFDNPKDVKGYDNNEIIKSMTRLGFTKSKNGKRINGVLKRGWEKSESYQTFDSNPCNGATDATSLIDNDSSCRTPVTPPATDATEQENQSSLNLVAPVAPPVTEMQLVEPLQDRQVAPVAPVAPIQEFQQPSVDNEIDVAGSADLLRECIALQDWEMVEELAVGWTEEFKKAVWSRLTDEEKLAMNKLKSPAPESKPETLELSPGDRVRFTSEVRFKDVDPTTKMSSSAILAKVGAVAEVCSYIRNGKVEVSIGGTGEPFTWYCKYLEKIPTPAPAPTELPYLVDKIPLIREKSAYWSKSFNRKVTVWMIFDDDSEASCSIEGKSGRFSLKFEDLACIEDSPAAEFREGDTVLVTVGKHKDKWAKVTSVVYQNIYLKSDATGKSLRVPFYAHQLVKS